MIIAVSKKTADKSPKKEKHEGQHQQQCDEVRRTSKQNTKLWNYFEEERKKFGSRHFNVSDYLKIILYAVSSTYI